MPKLVIFRLLAQAVRSPEPVRLVLRDGTAERPLADLAIHAVDVVLSDAPLPPTVRIKAFSQGGIGIFAAPTAVEREVRRQYGERVVGRVEMLAF